MRRPSDDGGVTRVRALAFPVACAIASLVVACGSDDPASSSEAEISTGRPETSTALPDAGDERAVGPVVDCPVGGAIEVESNDTRATANAFTELTFCGVLSTPQDVDYSTFDTPSGTKLSVFQGVIMGKVEFELTLNNGPPFGPGETAKFGSGTYFVKAFTKSGKTASYSYRVQFDPG